MNIVLIKKLTYVVVYFCYYCKVSINIEMCIVKNEVILATFFVPGMVVVNVFIVWCVPKLCKDNEVS